MEQNNSEDFSVEQDSGSAEKPEIVEGENLEPSSQKKKRRAKSLLLVVSGFFLLIIILLIVAVVVSENVKRTQQPKENPNIVKNPQTIEQKLANQNEIQKFQDYSQLEEFLQGNVSSGNFGRGAIMPSMVQEEMGDSMMGGWETDRSMSNSALESKAAAPPGYGGSDDFSKTNVQVEGVDEADIIKTDGEYIYAVVDKNLFIVKAYPANETNVVAKIEFDDRPQNVYLTKNNLVVFGQNQQIRQKDFYKKYHRRSSYSFFKVFDISDKKNPRQIKDLDFEGNYSNSRMIGDYVYFLTTTPAQYYEEEIPVPRILDGGKEVYSYSQTDSSCEGCPEVFFVDMPYTNYQLVNVAAINVNKDAEKISSQVYLLPYNQKIYVSHDNMFLTYTKHVSEYDLMMEVTSKLVFPRLSQRNQEKIAKIQATEYYILSPAEKMAKINAIVERYISSLEAEQQTALQNEIEAQMKATYKDLAHELEKTVIHKIGISQNNLQYKGYGQVTGSVLNQFSMDEKDGFFRIATTKNRTWSRFFDNEELSRESYNNMYVLDDNMTVVGSLEKLAKDERIYSVRFMQDRAYMVTFKQMDPLFVIDLKDPSDPKVLGELKIPGFSNYLHPYDEKLLIGLGRETKENQFGGFIQEGLKLSLFDVSDVANPREVDKYVFEDNSSNSIATAEHKAFLFSKEKNLLAIPVSTSEPVFGGPEPLIEKEEIGMIAPQRARRNFRGAAVFHVDQNGFTLKGKIDHSDAQEKRVSWCGGTCYSSTVKRSLYIDDLLYTFSDKYIKMNDIANLSSVGEIELKKESSGDWKVVN